MTRAAYAKSFSDFKGESEDAILGCLAKLQDGDLVPTQRNAWLKQIALLRQCLDKHEEGVVCFEYRIPRMGKRVDNILLFPNAVLVLEFKINSKSHDRAAIHQTIDYALDLKNFHAESRRSTIVPILVSTNAPPKPFNINIADDGVCDVICSNADSLSVVIEKASRLTHGESVSAEAWLHSGYSPTPTIIEASQVLYRGHSVREIARSEAGADNLGATTKALNRIIDHAKARSEKAICLVTGIPGAGKTLAGLNLANERRAADIESREHAVFLSGNGPLVKVLQEALARDEVAQAKARNEKITKDDAIRKAKAFIQNIHHFRDECIRNSAPPTERVVVFDEAQRAWNKAQTSSFMIRKRGLQEFDMSEPAFLIGAMNRHDDWAVVVCLVGGGQEINTGEAGMEEWLRALRDKYTEWTVHLPDQLTAKDYLPSMRLEELGVKVSKVPNLHLGISIRSFRSESLSRGIGSLLDGPLEAAKHNLASAKVDYPIFITRCLDKAKTWVRKVARGTERYGLLASSGARRLKPLGLHSGGVKGNECNWFLDADNDVRSSFYLEDAATEFEVQGLELDWAIVVWDGDFIYDGGGWIYREFRGSRWQFVRKSEDQRYRLNAYRVLLTRARQGVAIVVPEGNSNDHTRLPSFYDPTWQYLKALDLTCL